MTHVKQFLKNCTGNRHNQYSVLGPRVCWIISRILISVNNHAYFCWNCLPVEIDRYILLLYIIYLHTHIIVIIIYTYNYYIYIYKLYIYMYITIIQYIYIYHHHTIYCIQYAIVLYTRYRTLVLCPQMWYSYRRLGLYHILEHKLRPYILYIGHISILYML